MQGLTFLTYSRFTPRRRGLVLGDINSRSGECCSPKREREELRMLSATSRPGEESMDFERIRVSLRRDDLA